MSGHCIVDFLVRIALSGERWQKGKEERVVDEVVD